MAKPLARVLAFVMAVTSVYVPAAHAGAGPGQLCGGPGDFNGDGFDDLAIGAPGDETAGTVTVLYGSASGVDGGDAPSQIWRQGVGGLGGAGGNEDFGSATASGDFNGDGYDDLAVGVPHETDGTTTDGSVHVIYGSAAGLQATAPDDQEFEVDTAGVSGQQASTDFGQAVAAGDFNGDGFADLAVGDPENNVGDQHFAGVVHVLYGSADGIQSTGSGGPDDQRWTQTAAGADGDGNSDVGDRFGQRLEAGQMGNGARCDLAIGVPSESTPNVYAAGGVNVLYGASGGLSVAGSEFWWQSSDGILGAIGERDYFGLALAACDYDGDGDEDLAIGVPNDRTSPSTFGGSVSILVSRGASGLGSRGDRLWSQNTDGIVESAQSGDAFGWSLADGDFDGDGACDLGIGVPGEDFSGIDAAGKVQVLYGRVGPGIGAARDETFSQASTALTTDPERVDQFGYSLGSGEWRGGAHAGLSVGVPYEGRSGETAAGIAHVLYGSAEPNGIRLTGASNLTLQPAGTLDLFGFAV